MDLTTFAARFLENERTLMGTFRLEPASLTAFTVVTPRGGRGVDLNDRFCTCAIWRDMGLPCRHAMSVIKFRGLPTNDFVNIAYHEDSFKKAYEKVLRPLDVRHLSQDHQCRAPPKQRKRGRKATN